MAAFLALVSGLFGALGVAGAAYAAHGGTDGRLAGTAAAILLVHAPALLALAGLNARMPRTSAPTGLAVIVGVGLFSGDLAARVLGGARLFVNAAPAGGMVLIAAWLAIGIGVAIGLARHR